MKNAGILIELRRENSENLTQVVDALIDMVVGQLHTLNREDARFQQMRLGLAFLLGIRQRLVP